MFVEVDYKKDGDRFEYVMYNRDGSLMTDRNQAIKEAEWDFNVEPSTAELHLVECEGKSIEDFYKLEEEQGGYDPFWSLERN